ncbi:MAG: TonB-dependent receptor [Tannerella sp.]|jgi:TonB-linked SusC/RagA family outer membrane protein|nr:TonB-dependent receptor [Tannerella sp.]
MRFTVCLWLLFSGISFAGNLSSQNARVSLNRHRAQLRDVLEEIERQTDYLFISNTEVNLERTVSLHVTDRPVLEALDRLFEGTDLAYAVEGINIVITKRAAPVADAAPGQTGRRITGSVVDAGGESVIGANIIEKGTANGAVTDVDGRFSLSVEGNAVLQVSYIGYITQDVTVGNRTSLQITLTEDSRALEEVIVIGYGVARKSDLTGAVAHADLQVMENASNVNMMQLLKGTVPGLNIGVATTAGGNPSISIRGRNSISGEQSPLIVLDGIIYRGEFTDINPADISSIDVLKDASSTAIYGSQGANGVILITTKNSTKNSKPIIHYSGQFSVQSLTNNKLRPNDAEGYVQLLKDAFLEESRMGTDLLQYNPNFDVTLKFRDQSAIDNYNGGNIKNTTDWWGLLSNSLPYVQNHNINVNGKSDYASYFVSMGLTDQKNLVASDNYKRYSFRVNLDLKITDWLKVGTQSYYNISDFSGANIGFSGLGQVPTLVSPYNDDDGSLKELYYLGTLNPLLSRDNPNEDVRNSLSGTFYADISIPFIKGLSYRTNYSHNLVTYRYYEFNPYSNNDNGAARKYNTRGYTTTFDNILTYKRDFGKHSVNATLVYGIEERMYENTNARSSYFTDMTLGYNELQAGQTDLNTVESDAWKETSLYTMARLVYSFNDRYIFTGTIRRDGFSGFTSNNKFATFPSAALAWRMSEEDFVKNNVAWLDNLKLRVSYGMGGNRTAGRYSSMAQMATSVNGYLYGDGATGQGMQYVSTMANNNLKWETTTSTNIGIDFSVLNGRIFGNYEYYYSKTKDLLYNIYVPIINGAADNSIPTNIGKLRNFGHEFSITGVPVKTKDWEWFVTGNFALNNNKVLTIIGQDADGDGKEDDIISSNIFIGQPLGTIYNYNITGIWQVADYNAGIIPAGFTYGVYKIEDIDNSGDISADKDRKIIGYTDPLYSFSIQNTVRYKDLELKMMINSVQGGNNHYLGQPLSTLPIRDQLQNWNWVDFDYWTPENPNARYQQLGIRNTIVGNAFSRYVSRSFVRLQEVSLAYHIPSNLLSKLNVASAKVYISGTNLLTLTDWDGWDPEAAQGVTWDLSSGYPIMRNFTLGLNFEF